MKLISSVAALALSAIAVNVNAAYLPTGIQTNVTAAQVSSWGWTTCYSDNGADTTSLSAIKSSCSGTHLMLADRVPGSDSFAILAAAARSDVLMDTGDGNATHSANGTLWYYSEFRSLGYTDLGNEVFRGTCDGLLQLPTRVGSCWHTSNGNLIWGYGYNNGSGFEVTQQRVILIANVADNESPVTVPEPGSLALMGLALAGLAATRRRKG